MLFSDEKGIPMSNNERICVCVCILHSWLFMRVYKEVTKRTENVQTVSWASQRSLEIIYKGNDGIWFLPVKLILFHMGKARRGGCWGKVRIAGRWSEREIRNCQGWEGTGRESLTGRIEKSKKWKRELQRNMAEECEAAGWRAEIMGCEASSPFLPVKAIAGWLYSVSEYKAWNNLSLSNTHSTRVV